MQAFNFATKDFAAALRTCWLLFGIYFIGRPTDQEATTAMF